jgi:hypothetical protein
VEKLTSVFVAGDLTPEPRSSGKRVVEETNHSRVFEAEIEGVHSPRPHSARRPIRPIGEETTPKEMKRGMKISANPKTTYDKDPGVFVDRLGRRLSCTPEKGQRFVHKGPSESAKGIIYFQAD